MGVLVSKSEQRYLTFGDVRTDMDTAGETDFGFTGEWTDGTGLLNLRARYMNTSIGRFMTRDTWAGDYNRPLSLNRWNYVEGNPINFTDPSGFGHFGPGIVSPIIDPIIGILAFLGNYCDIGDFDPSILPIFVLTWEPGFKQHALREDRTKRVLQMLEGYQGSGAWWKSANGKIDANKIKAWILEHEGDTLWWNPDTPAEAWPKSYPHPITLMAKLINKEFFGINYFTSTINTHVTKLSKYTVFFNPQRSGNQFGPEDWAIWLKPPIQGALNDIAFAGASPDRGVTNFWLETELRDGCKEKDPRNYQFVYFRPGFDQPYNDEVFFDNQVQCERCVTANAG